MEVTRSAAQTLGGRPRLCDIPSGCCFFTGPWTVTRSSLRVLRRVAAFCRPLWPVFLLVSFPRQRSPVVGTMGLCWLVRGSLCGFAAHSPPHPGRPPHASRRFRVRVAQHFHPSIRRPAGPPPTWRDGHSLGSTERCLQKESSRLRMNARNRGNQQCSTVFVAYRNGGGLGLPHRCHRVRRLGRRKSKMLAGCTSTAMRFGHVVGGSCDWPRKITWWI